MKINEIIRKSFKENYEGIYKLSEKKKEKLIKLWTMRACRFFVEGNLDTPMVEEDIYPTNLKYGIEFEKKEIKKLFNKLEKK